MKKITVINAGIGGNNTRDLLARMDRDVFAHHPALVCLLAGTNDCLNSQNATTMPECQYNIRLLTERIREAGSDTLCMTLPPCYEPYLFKRHKAEFFADASPNERIQELNVFIHDFTAEQGIALADIHRAFSSASENGASRESLLRNPANSGEEDGVHPTADGYALIARVAHEVIRTRKLAAARVVCFGDSITRGAHMQGEGAASGQTYPGQLATLLCP